MVMLVIKHSPFLHKVSFVPNKDNDDVAAPLSANLFNPFWSIQKGLPTWIMNYQVRKHPWDMGTFFQTNSLKVCLMSIKEKKTNESWLK
jgi:hypothetical protein